MADNARQTQKLLCVDTVRPNFEAPDIYISVFRNDHKIVSSIKKTLPSKKERKKEGRKKLKRKRGSTNHQPTSPRFFAREMCTRARVHMHVCARTRAQSSPIKFYWNSCKCQYRPGGSIHCVEIMRGAAREESVQSLTDRIPYTGTMPRHAGHAIALASR